MIKFFRRIRQRLLTENKFSKYLLYAIGEIVLVVIGILIALQINNWNTNNNLRALENELLLDIRENLNASVTNLESDISFNKITLANYEKILSHIKEGLPYNNSLDSAFSYISYWSDPHFTYTAYETLKSKGLDIIQNDSLKIAITEIYEQYFPFIISELKGEWELHQSVVLPFIAKNILYVNTEIARPNNYHFLKSNDEFHNIMGMKMIIRKYTIQNAEMTKDKVSSLIVQIDKELERK
jgi:cell division protein FtsL